MDERSGRGSGRPWNEYPEMGEGMTVRRMTRLVIVVVAVMVMFMGLICPCGWAGVSGAEAADEDFGDEFFRDSILLEQYSGWIEFLVGQMRARGLYDRNRTKDFSMDERERFYDLWASYIDCMRVLEDINERYKVQGLTGSGQRRARAFTLSYSSFVARLYGGYALVSMTLGNDLYEKKLDDANESLGIPGGIYSLIKWNTIHVEDVSALYAGRAYMKVMQEQLQKEGLLKDPMIAGMLRRMEAQYAYIKDHLDERGVEYFALNGFDIVRDGFGKAWFPLQKGVAGFMGDTRFRQKGRYLITPEQVRRMEEVLEPGDIIVERRNWYLSNVGLPGFWPHAELYLGDTAKLGAYFDDAEVTAYFRARGPYEGYVDYLERQYPDKMAQYAKAAHDGNRRRVIEAVAEGVSMHSLEEGTLADYIGVMRPRLSKLDKALAIEQAFMYVGRPYDYDFDFLTDSTLVCSELVYKAYLPGHGKRGLSFALTEMAGRKVLSPNNIVKKFNDEYDSPGRELEFVYFLDGSEQDGRAYSHGRDEFMASQARPKWDAAQR